VPSADAITGAAGAARGAAAGGVRLEDVSRARGWVPVGKKAQHACSGG
jgi:hypothetical protein